MDSWSPLATDQITDLIFSVNAQIQTRTSGQDHMISVDQQLEASIEIQSHSIQAQKDLINTQTNILKQIQMNVVLVDMI